LRVLITNTDYTVVRKFPLTANASLQAGEPVRPHSCISKKIYKKVPRDGELQNSNNNNEVSTDDDDDDDDIPELPVITSVRRRTPRQVQSGLTEGRPSTNNRATTPIAAPATTSSLQRNHSLSAISTLPSVIWENPWTAQTGPYAGLQLYSLSDDAYEAATRGTDGSELHIHGRDVSDLATITTGIIREAIKEGDFMKLLSPDRSFNM